MRWWGLALCNGCLAVGMPHLRLRSVSHLPVWGCALPARPGPYTTHGHRRARGDAHCESRQSAPFGHRHGRCSRSGQRARTAGIGREGARGTTTKCAPPLLDIRGLCRSRLRFCGRGLRLVLCVSFFVIISYGRCSTPDHRLVAHMVRLAPVAVLAQLALTCTLQVCDELDDLALQHRRRCAAASKEGIHYS